MEEKVAWLEGDKAVQLEQLERYERDEADRLAYVSETEARAEAAERAAKEESRRGEELKAVLAEKERDIEALCEARGQSDAAWAALTGKAAAIRQLAQADALSAAEDSECTEAFAEADLADAGGEAELPILSVVIPVYNTEKYLVRCIESVLSQTLSGIEAIVVDDGSEGDVEKALEPYKGRVRLIRSEENEGLFRARVKGAAAARGRYLAFLDSDDSVSCDFYRSLVARAEEAGADVAMGRTVWERGGERFVFTRHEAATHFEELEGEEVRGAFFETGYGCYSWHTVWNKAYRRDLWERCAPVFERVDRHLVMTEDILFSTVLMCSAKKAVRTHNDAYFYAQNDAASTDTRGITLKKFLKNADDIAYVFSFLDGYLEGLPLAAGRRALFNEGRARYAAMWGALAKDAFRGRAAREAAAAAARIGEVPEGFDRSGEGYFERVRKPWTGRIEYLKERLAKSGKGCASFDIFDTLVERPLGEPAHLRRLMEAGWRNLTGRSVSFAELRARSEDAARRAAAEQGFSDVTLEEIYAAMAERYGVTDEAAAELMRLEKELEGKYCRPRATGAELLGCAAASGKKVILISDMYLDRDTVAGILENCGIRGWKEIYLSSESRRLKSKGELFRYALEKAGIEAADLIHVGDSWQADIEGSAAAGIESIFLPKSMDVYEGKIEGCQVNRCGKLDGVFEGFLDIAAAHDELGSGCMRALAAQKHFDDPYRDFDEMSDLDVDPYMLGYGPLGMHCLGLLKWMLREIRQRKPSKAVFLARDGYLPKKVLDAFCAETGNEILTEYAFVSRRSLLPLMAESPEDLYFLPIEPRAHTPATLTELLRFAAKEGTAVDESGGSGKAEHRLGQAWLEVLSRLGFAADSRFEDREECDEFMKAFIEYAYDPGRHAESAEAAKAYLKAYDGSELFFDVGYSGRIQAAITKAVGRATQVLFVHGEYAETSRLKAAAGFDVNAFYGMKPSAAALLREYLISDGSSGACSGYKLTEEGAVPIFEAKPMGAVRGAAAALAQRGAMDFVRDYLRLFKDEAAAWEFSEEAVSLPFEGFLSAHSSEDLRMFENAASDDFVYGANDEIGISDCAASAGAAPMLKPDSQGNSAGNIENLSFMEAVNRCGKLRRGIIFLAADRKVFFKKLRGNLSRLKPKRRGLHGK